MENKISKESYDFVCEMAKSFCYGNTSSYRFDKYVSVGLEGLIKAVKDYKEDSKAKFSTYAYRCIKNAMINEMDYYKRNQPPMDDDFDFGTYSGATTSMCEDNFEKTLKNVILTATKNNARNAKIVEKYIGLNCEPIKLNDLAEMFNLTHESVRLVCVKTLKNIRENKTAKSILYSFVG